MLNWFLSANGHFRQRRQSGAIMRRRDLRMREARRGTDFRLVFRRARPRPLIILDSSITFADYFRSVFPRSISRRPLRHFYRVHSLQEEYRSDICSCRGSIPNLTRICAFLRRNARATYPKFRHISRLLLFFNPTSEITFLTDQHYIYIFIYHGDGSTVYITTT